MHFRHNAFSRDRCESTLIPHNRTIPKAILGSSATATDLDFLHLNLLYCEGKNSKFIHSCIYFLQLESDFTNTFQSDFVDPLKMGRPIWYHLDLAYRNPNSVKVQVLGLWYVHVHSSVLGQVLTYPKYACPRFRTGSGIEVVPFKTGLFLLTHSASILNP